MKEGGGSGRERETGGRKGRGEEKMFKYRVQNAVLQVLVTLITTHSLLKYEETAGQVNKRTIIGNQ